MKVFIFLTLLIGLSSCGQQDKQIESLQNKIDKLEARLSEAYKPGFGELMSGVQAHHAKLWFAGLNKNWRLADFEVHEIIESLQSVEKYQAARKETKDIAMIYPPLDSVKKAIEKKDLKAFKANYRSMTNTCNSCHKITDFEFNIVTVPTEQTFSNQKF
jgi:hypothetical protein